MPDKATDQNVIEFKAVTKNTKRATFTGPVPPDALLEKYKDDDMIQGPDGTQWIVKKALPRRWERAKKRVTQRS